MQDPFELLADATRRLAELTRGRARTGRRHADGWTLRWLARDDLIAMRRALDRPKDVRRAAELAALRP